MKETKLQKVLNKFETIVKFADGSQPTSKDFNHRVKGLFKTVKNIICDINCGIKSNIPLCCILFWIIIWKPIFHLLPITGSMNRYLFSKKYLKYLKIEVEYIPCPICIFKNKANKLKHCIDNLPETCSIMCTVKKKMEDKL